MIPTIQQDPNDFAFLDLQAHTLRCRIYQHGAHITHLAENGEPPLLFLSRAARFATGAAIRGGIPVIAPWFGSHPTLSEAPSHGLVRTIPWEWVGHNDTPELATVALRTILTPSPAFDGHLELVLTAEIRNGLRITFAAHNTGAQPISCELALHPYFTVGDIREIRVSGLTNPDYRDKTDGFQRKTDTAPAIQFSGETDRVYLDTAAACVIHDPVLKRRIRIEKEQAPNTIVWNPGPEKSRQLPDLEEDDWLHFVCVEQGCLGDHALVLPPGESGQFTAAYTIEPLEG